MSLESLRLLRLRLTRYLIAAVFLITAIFAPASLGNTGEQPTENQPAAIAGAKKI